MYFYVYHIVCKMDFFAEREFFEFFMPAGAEITMSLDCWGICFQIVTRFLSVFYTNGVILLISNDIFCWTYEESIMEGVHFLRGPLNEPDGQ